MRTLGLVLAYLIAIAGIVMLIYDFLPPASVGWGDGLTFLVMAAIVYGIVYWVGKPLFFIRTLGLLLVLLGAIAGLALVIYDFLPPLSFGWEDGLTFLAMAAVVYGVVYLIGSSLNKKFDASVMHFLEGKQEKLFDDKDALRTFGFLLIVLLPYLLFLEVFALYAAILFVLLVLLLTSLAPSVPIGLYIALAIIFFGTGFAVLVGLFRLFFPKKRKTLGVEIGNGEQGALWQLTNSVAHDMDAKPIDKIILKPDSGIGVYLQGSIFRTIFGGGKRVLEIGLPSIHALSVDEFKAILAHEYGHFSNADTQWSSFTYAMSNSLTNTLQSTPGLSQGGKGTSVIIALNPAYWILFLYVMLFYRVTNGFSRIREVMADIRAMNLYGGKAFRNGLMKVATNDTVFGEVIERNQVPELLKQGKTISNFSKFMELAYQSVDATAMENVRKEILDRSQKHNIYDSHPALKVRIDYAAKFADKEEADARPLTDLFENWEALNQKSAELYNARLVNYLQALAQQNKKT